MTAFNNKKNRFANKSSICDISKYPGKTYIKVLKEYNAQ